MPKLTIDIEARLAQFQDALSRVESTANGVAGRMSKAFSGVGTALGAAFGGVSAGLVAAQFKDFVQSAIDAQDEMGKLAQKTGVSVESLSGLKYAAALSDVSMEQLGQSLAKLGRNMADAQAHTGEAKVAFDAMKISVTGAGGQLKSTEDVLLEIAQQFADMEDSAGKTALAIKLFGRAGAELIPFLNQGAAGIAKLSDEARKLGLVMSADAARASEEFNDNIKRLSAAGEGFKLSVANQFLPALNQVIEKMVEARKEGGLLQSVLDGLRESMSIAFGDKHANDLGRINTQIAQTIEHLKAMEKIATTPAQQAAVDRARSSLAGLIEERRRLADLAQLNAPARKSAIDEGGFPIPEGGGGKKKAPALPDEAALKKAFDEAEKLRREDIRGWVAHADAVFAAADEENQALAKIADEYWKEQDKLRKEDIKGWIEHADAVFAAADAENEALNKAVSAGKSYTEVLEDQAKKTEEAWRDLGFTFESAFEKALRPGADLRDILKGLEEDIIRIIARVTVTQPLSEWLTGTLKGAGGGGGGGGGLVEGGSFWGSIADWLKGVIPSFDVGSNYVPRDMLAMVHKGEKIIPAGQSAGGVEVNIYGAPEGTQVRQRQGDNGLTLDVILDGVERNSADGVLRGDSALSSALERTYGLSRAPGMVR